MAGLRFEKRGKTWRYIFEGAKVDGKRSRISKGGFRTKAEASEAGALALSEYNNSGMHFVPSEMSFNDFLDYWMQNYCEVNLKTITQENYRKRIEFHIKPELGAYKLSSITTTSLQSFINKKAKDHYSRNTLSVLRGILSGSLGYAVKQNLIKYNPASNVNLPSYRNESVKSRTAPSKYIPKETIDRIFARFPSGSTSYIPLLLGYRCGLRLGEVFALTWDCIDFDKRTLTVDKQVQWNKHSQRWYVSNPKYNSIRTIEIDTELANILSAEFEKQKKSKIYYGENYTQLYINDDKEINSDGEGIPVSLVCIREDGTYTQPRIMHHASSIIHHQLGVEDFTFHSLRHTHATMLAENNAPPKYVQKRLGHKNIQMTMQVYQHLSQTISEQGKEILDNMY